MRTMTRLMHIIDNAENPGHVLQATAQLLRYLRFQPDVWPEYPDKTDKKSDLVPDTIPATHVVEDDMGNTLFEASKPQTLSTEPLGPSEPQTSRPPDNPDKNPDQYTLNYPLSTINSRPPLTPEFLESIEDYALADIVRQNPIMGKILAHKYAYRPDEPEPAYA